MTCREVADFLADYVSGDLAADVRARFDRHLGVCPNCRAYLATYRATIELSRKAFDQPDPDIPDELVTAIRSAVRRG